MGAGESSVAWKGYDDQLLKDTKEQTVSIPDTAEDGATAVRRHPAAKDGFKMYLTDEESKTEMDSGWKCVKIALKKFAKRKMFGYRPFTDPDKNPLKRGKYQWDTFETIGKQIYAAGAGLRSLGLGDKTNVGIFSINRSEWVISHLSNWNCTYRTVALYDTLGAQAVQYIVWHAELSAIFVEKDKLPQLFEAIKSCTKDKELKLKYIIQFDYQKKYNNKHEMVSDDDVKKAKELNIELFGFTELLKRGSGNYKVEKAEEPPKYDETTKGDDDNTDKPKDEETPNDDNTDKPKEETETTTKDNDNDKEEKK